MRVRPATEAGQRPLRQLTPSTSQRSPRCHPLNLYVGSGIGRGASAQVPATNRRLESGAPSTESRGPEVTELRARIQHELVIGAPGELSAQS